MRLRLPHPPGSPPSRRWWITTLAINAGIVLVVFAAIQLIPARPGNPPVIREPVWDSPETRARTVQACYDCHSNETQWPWYSRIAPVSWLLAYDVVEGREDLNFSEWDRHAVSDIDPDEPFAPKTLVERIEDEIRSGRMPPDLYQLNHPAARLSDAEREALIAGLLRTVEQNQTTPDDTE
ncbi:MAG: heme-binding domain-containing protein [Chloroflexi bacterium]|nr:heme-binding domain-containing protein [Chloroflexota bacterium]